MTGGQTSLAFSMDGEQQQNESGEGIQRVARTSGLRVVAASDEEVMAHEQRLDTVMKRAAAAFGGHKYIISLQKRSKMKKQANERPRKKSVDGQRNSLNMRLVPDGEHSAVR